MNIKSIISFVFLCLSYSLNCDALIANPEGSDQHFLLTFPRSGTNLTCCYIQSLTFKPLGYLYFDEIVLPSNRLNFQLDFSKKPIYREHIGKELIKLNKNNNKLVFVIRDYKESIHRQNKSDYVNKNINSEEFMFLFTNNSDIFKWYINNVKTFQLWDKNNRLIIYYEDLINDPEREIKKILSFLGEDIPVFMTNEYLNEVYKNCLNSYHNQHILSGGSYSKGIELNYHSNKFPVNIINKIDEYVEKTFPNLWKFYLNRYKKNN